MIKAIFCTLIIFSFTVSAGEDCPGKVTEIMDHSSLSLCDSHLAFRLDSTGTTYLCAISERSDSMVLTAYAAGKTISPRLDPPVQGNCLSYTSNYIAPAYIRILD